MAENKKSFIVYSDWKETFEKLPNEIAGKLIKHIFSYVNDENPVSEDYIIEALFATIKNTLKRDLSKWEDQINQRREAGKKSANQRKSTTVQSRSTKINDRSISLNEKQRKATVSVSVSDNVINDVVDRPTTSTNFEFDKNTIKFQYETFMKTDSVQKDTLCMSNGKTKKEIEIACIGFVLHLLNSGETMTSYKPDFAKHFKAWLTKFGISNLSSIDKTQIQLQFKKLNLYQDVPN